MSLNLLEMANSALTDQFLEKASSFLAEDVKGVSNGFDAAIPSLLGSVISSGSDAAGAGNLLGMIKQGGFNGDLLDNLGDIFEGKSASLGLLDAGGSILKTLIGNKSAGIVDVISKVAGISSASSNKLLSMAAPIIMNMIGRVVKTNALDAVGLSSLLGSQKSLIESTLPAGIGSLLGLESVTEAVGEEVGSSAMTGSSFDTPSTSGSGRLVKWLIPLAIVLIGLFVWQQGCFSEGPAAAVDSVGEAASGTMDKMAEVALDTKDKMNKAVNEALEGVEFAVGSVGDQFSKFLASGAEDIGTFKFANLQFESGSAIIAGETGVEVDNLAAVLKAYPNVNIQINGYTDSQGDDNMNQGLSEQRANAVMTRLVAESIASDRLSAVGHGEADPVGDNSTAEGRAMNRRIEIEIISK